MEKTNKNTDDIGVLTCPVCKANTLRMSKTEYDLPDKDKMLIIKFECSNCDYHANDLIPLTTRTDAGISKLRVSSKEDLRSKVYRSPTAKLEIPELELIVEPGPRAQFYFTNIEGILYRFQNAVLTYQNSIENQEELNDVQEIIHNLEKASEGEFSFTLIITDPSGGSYILPIDESKYTFTKIDITSK